MKKLNATLIDPDSGEQACGEVGPGRLADPACIVEKLLSS